jgi:hypothetical protein
MLFGEILWREDFFGSPFLDQKRPAFDDLFLFGYG